MKKTTLFCDCCQQEIKPVTDGSYPRARIQLSQAGTSIELHEVCQPCFDALARAVATVCGTAQLPPVDPTDGKS